MAGRYGEDEDGSDIVERIEMHPGQSHDAE